MIPSITELHRKSPVSEEAVQLPPEKDRSLPAQSLLSVLRRIHRNEKIRQEWCERNNR